ncbi:AAA family ATPase [Lutimonas saemankumensis]|uniref:ATP-dependent DNA helicase n=1 Tax=Lutimonas saemankumensis TaxID=483016 RepID=UPI001CD561F1|nr:AAA family ATPase [Lutimonas saemankumensis]MCA0931498.1 AAA family ATPase [Lutimonas saemankumensis]
MKKTNINLYKDLLQGFGFDPTMKQNLLLKDLSDFVLSGKRFSLFLIKGYAGTGKTTVISALVNHLNSSGFKSVLLAPTGRAAKVMSSYSNKTSLTIHKKIYYPKNELGAGLNFTLQQNKHRNTIFVVDESSMIPDGSLDGTMFGTRSLLHDLMTYVYSGRNCKLILVGDTAQLPPVNMDLSPALDKDHLESAFSMEVHTVELDEVMRQHKDSGILFNASRIRDFSSQYKLNEFKFNLNFNDVERLTDRYDIQDAIFSAYSEGLDKTVFIVRSNKRANLYNQEIRKNVLGYDGELASGDFVMVVRNNYFWLKDAPKVGFIANGDICEVLEIFRFKDLYGFRFAEVKVRLVDYEDEPPFEAVLLLDTLHSNSPSLTMKEGNKLFQAVAEDYAQERSKYKRLQMIKSNKYFNALQVKFSYALTCHKTQGGQWENVFVEQPYLPEGEDNSYLRWLYTAVTRAQKKLFLIGFKDSYFENC